MGALACAVYVLVPGLRSSELLPAAIGFYALLGLIAGLRINRPAAARAWSSLAVGVALFWLSDLYSALNAPHGRLSLLAGVLDIAAYVPLTAGLVALARARTQRADRGVLADAVIMTLGASLIPALFEIAPLFAHAGFTTSDRVILTGRPIGDVFLLGATFWLSIGRGRRGPELQLLRAAVAILIVSDFVRGVLALHGDYHGQAWLLAAEIGFYLLLAAAALHPSMTRLSEPGPTLEARLTAPRLVLLAAATLIGPALGIVAQTVLSDGDALGAAIASVALFCLVLGRMAGLVRQR
ncbi:MAG: hypothetical protein ACRDMX_17285, partial [Solirubrobacteraceae bacterium]